MQIFCKLQHLSHYLS